MKLGKHMNIIKPFAEKSTKSIQCMTHDELVSYIKNLAFNFPIY